MFTETSTVLQQMTYLRNDSHLAPRLSAKAKALLTSMAMSFASFGLLLPPSKDVRLVKKGKQEDVFLHVIISVVSGASCFG